LEILKNKFKFTFNELQDEKVFKSL
jgi:hypothetical protein